MSDIAEAFKMPKPKHEDILLASKELDENRDGKLSFEELKPVMIDFV